MFRDIELILLNEYNLEVLAVTKSSVGAGSDTWIVTCRDGKYVMKYPCESEINHPEQEALLCEYLNQRGIPVCQFVKNKKGEYITFDDKGRLFHVQRFIEGQTYDWHTAPKWLMTEMSQLLGKIHTALKEYLGLPIGIGKDFFTYMTPERALDSYRNSLSIAKKQRDEEVFICNRLNYRLSC